MIEGLIEPLVAPLVEPSGEGAKMGRWNEAQERLAQLELEDRILDERALKEALDHILKVGEAMEQTALIEELEKYFVSFDERDRELLGRITKPVRYRKRIE